MRQASHRCRSHGFEAPQDLTVLVEPRSRQLAVDPHGRWHRSGAAVCKRPRLLCPPRAIGDPSRNAALFPNDTHMANAPAD
jgi:hypothetical protein